MPARAMVPVGEFACTCRATGWQQRLLRGAADLTNLPGKFRIFRDSP